MATVPIQTTPSVQLSAQGPGQVQAGPDVQAVKNFAPEQIQQAGAAMTKAGNMIATIQTKLQDDYNDARAKQLYNNYSREVQALELDFSQRQGANALGGSFDGTISRLDELRQQYIAEADNDRIGMMFDQRAQVLMTSSAGSMTRHSISQGQQYALAEGKAEAANDIEYAARHWNDYRDPEGTFNTYTASAIIKVNQLADSMGLAADSHQREQMVRGAYQDLHSSVVFNMAEANQFVQAREYLEDAWNNGEIGVAEYQRLVNGLEQGVTRERGIDFGTRVYEGAAAQGAANAGTFEQASGMILMLEGGYVADDAGAGPTKYGINGRANGLTDDQVANLTQAEALEIYRTRYWNAVGIDNLPPSARMIAFDAAVNQGQGAARTMIREATNADGSFDLGRFISLRRDRYQATANSGRFAEMPQEERDMYMRSWENRMARITGGSPVGIDREDGLPNLNQMVTYIRNTIEDPAEQDVAIAQVTQTRQEQALAIAQEYRNDLLQAQDVAFARIGGWQDISTELLGRIKPADMARLREGPNRGDDPDTYLMLLQNPRMVRMAPRDENGNRIPGQQGLEDYRLKLSEPVYRSFVAQAMEPPDAPNNPINASADQDMLNATLLRVAGQPDPSGVGVSDLAKLLEPKSDDQRNDLIRLTELWRSRIDEAQRERGNTPLSRPEKQQILDNILLDRVYQSDTVMLVPAGSTFTRMFELGADELDNTYVVVADNGRSEQLLVANIPADQTTLITDAFRRSSNSGAQLDANGNVVRLGRYPTTQEIAQIWVSGGRRR
jgi:lysozyme family protein